MDGHDDYRFTSVDCDTARSDFGARRLQPSWWLSLRVSSWGGALLSGSCISSRLKILTTDRAPQHYIYGIATRQMRHWDFMRNETGQCWDGIVVSLFATHYWW